MISKTTPLKTRNCNFNKTYGAKNTFFDHYIGRKVKNDIIYTILNLGSNGLFF